MPSQVSRLIDSASARAPVNRKGVGAASVPRASREAAVDAVMSVCWSASPAEQKVKYRGSTPLLASSSARAITQRYGYWAVCERESTTTGTPSLQDGEEGRGGGGRGG